MFFRSKSERRGFHLLHVLPACIFLLFARNRGIQHLYMKRFFTLLSLFTLSAAHTFAEFRSGVAVRVVTPDPLLPVSGGVGPSNPTTEKKGDLTVRALVFENNGTRVAIVGSDFLGFPSILGAKVRAKVQGIPPQNIL